MNCDRSSNLPLASLSLDLDNQWSYLKTHGDRGWQSLPSYFDVVVPRILTLLAQRRLTITFFVVGQDAALSKNRNALAAVAAAGHEVANHSFSHEPWLHRYGREEVIEELSRAEDAIESAMGCRTRGFRGPGFSLSQQTLEVLDERGYVYDASTLPTFLGPLARMYYFLKSDLTDEERRKRALLFGGFRDGFRSIRPYRWDVGSGQLLEIPVTTMPWLRAPFHLSYVQYLGSFAPWLGVAYFNLATSLCRLAHADVSFLLHPLDFLGRDDVPELAFFPAMGVPAARKLTLANRVLRKLAGQYRVVSMTEHANAARMRPGLPRVVPSFCANAAP